MDVEVHIGGWEHECCGTAVERDRLVDLVGVRSSGPDGRPILVETHHDVVGTDQQVRIAGRVRDIRVVRVDGTTQPIHRLPGGLALRGLDADDDGQLETPWTREPVAAGREFVLTVHGHAEAGSNPVA